MFVPGFRDAVRQVPRRLLRNAQILVQFHARCPFDAGREQVCRQHPPLRPQVRALHNRSRVVGEELPVGTAAVGHGRVFHVGLDIVVFAAGAVDSIRPSLLDNQRFRHGIIGEHPHDIDKGETVPIGNYIQEYPVPVATPFGMVRLFDKLRDLPQPSVR